uniref:c-type cytochrome n=1 Tax=Limnohabitans sp. TaxID=1907725 RepID=UPI004048D2A5
MKYAMSFASALLMLATSMPAQAQFAKPEDAIKYRKASFTVMAAHFGRLGAMVNGRVPYDAKAAAENADVVATLSKLPWAAFGEGTDKGDTRAKPEIWKEAAKYKEAADKMQAEIEKLNTAAKAGNIDALKAAFGPTVASCKACHDNFRKD